MANTKIELVSSKDSPTGVAGKKVDGVFESNVAITSDVLSPQKDFEIPPEVPSTIALGEQARFETQTDSFDEQQKKEAENVNQLGDTFQQSVTDFMEAQLQPGEVELTGREASREGGQDDIQIELTDIQDQLRQEQHALNRRIEEIEKNALGGTRGQVRGAVEFARRESLKTQADLSIKQMSIQGRFNNAKAVADRAVQIQLEQSRSELESKRFIVGLNESLFSKAEKRFLDKQDAAEERRINNEEAELQALSDAKIDAYQNAFLNNAPTSVFTAIQGGKTVEEVVLAGGRFGSVDLLQRQQLQANVDASIASTALNTFKLKEARDKKVLIDEAVARGEVVLSPEQADRAGKIAKEFEDEAGEFKKTVAAYNRILASAEDPSPAGDLAVVFNFMKMLDPGSVVRESEFALAASTGSLKEAMKNKFGKVVTGEILEFTREDFVDRAGKIYLGQLDQQIELENRFRAQATDLFGLPDAAASLIVQDIRATGSVSEAAFAVVLNKASDEQLQFWIDEGLLPNSTPQK